MILLYMNRRWQNSQVFVLALLACFCTMNPSDAQFDLFDALGRNSQIWPDSPTLF